MSKTINPFGKEVLTMETEFCGRKLTVETGRVAFQAQGSVLVRYGDTVVMGIAHTSDFEVSMDYFPLMVDYEEKMYAAGKISGSRFIKREGRPSEDATLTSRLIDRPIRPLFPKGFRHEVQVIAHVLSVDPDIRTDIIGMIAASTALSITPAPFEGPIGGVRMGLVDGNLVANPTVAQLENSKLDLIVAGTEDAIMMVEAGADIVDEATMVDALQQAHEAIQPVVKLQKELREKLGVKTMEYDVKADDEELKTSIQEFIKPHLGENLRDPGTLEREEKVRELREKVVEEFVKEDADGESNEHVVKEIYAHLMKQEIRRAILEDGKRPDERTNEEIRPLSSEVGILPRTHGSALFTRGLTQSLATTTLASSSYAQLVDTMEREGERTFMLHYNFPGYSTGEVRRPRSTSRREIGHGALAERALAPVMPGQEEFPYTTRVVSECTSSAGSTSMASVCGGCLSLMDAGVPLKAPVAGIAMGLISDGTKNVVLSDIMDQEDFSGDMDFKVAGTAEGITALQMDIKIKGVSKSLLEEALAQAKRARMEILKSMLSTLPKYRDEMADYAPRIDTITIDEDKVKVVIGKGGETINRIIDETGVEIDIKDGGVVMVASSEKEGRDKAIAMIQDLTFVPTVGETYDGTVVKILEFGAFVRVKGGTEGLVHVSEMAEERVNHPQDVVSEGDVVRVKLTAIDDRGRYNFSMKQAQ